MAQGANGEYNLKVKVAVESQSLEVAKRNVRATREETQKFTFDMNTLSNVTRAGVGILREFGVASLLSLGGIAATAPSLAGSMAKIEVAAFGVADSMGKALKPVFDWFGSALQGVNEFLNANPIFAQIAGAALFASAAVGVASASLSFLWGVFGPLVNIVWTLVGPTALGALQTMIAGFSFDAFITAVGAALLAIAPFAIALGGILASLILIKYYWDNAKPPTAQDIADAQYTGTQTGRLVTDWETGESHYENTGAPSGYANSNPNGIGNDPNWHGAGSDFQGGRDINLNLTITNQSGQIVDYTKFKFGTNTTQG